MNKHTFALIFCTFVTLYTSAQTTFQKTFGGMYTDWANTVTQTSDGGYFMLGGTVSFGTASNSIYVVKTNNSGDLLWTKTFGGMDYSFAYDGQQTSDGGYIITGTTEAFGAGVNDVILIKIDGAGDTLWSRTYGEGCFDYGNSVIQTNDGGYIVVGRTCFAGNPGWDLYMIKTNDIGDTLWTKSMGGGTGSNSGNSIKQTMDGGYVVAGNFSFFGTGSSDVCLIKTNSIGDTVFTKIYGGVDFDVPSSVQQTYDGGFIIGGYTNSFGAGNIDYYLIKTDSAGNLVWSKTYGGSNSEYCLEVHQTTDGGYILAGWTEDPANIVSDIYIVKTNSSGDTLWTRTYGGVNQSKGYSISPCNDGGYVVTGQTDSYGNNSDDIFLLKTDSMGNAGCSYINSIQTTVTTPTTTVSVPAITISLLTAVITSPSWMISSGGNDTTICTTVGISTIGANHQISVTVFPNPSTGNFIVSFEETILKGNLEILNALGEIVFSENITYESEKEIKLKNISKGIYFAKVFDGEKYYCRKIIIDQN